MKIVRFHPEAEEEFKQTSAWYDAKQEALGEDFEQEVQRAFSKFRNDPARFPHLRKKFQRCLANRFPFAIVFREEASAIFVIAVAHASRRPLYWQKRI